MGQSRKDKQEKRATPGTQEEDKQNNTICFVYHHTQANTNSTNKTRPLPNWM